MDRSLLELPSLVVEQKAKLFEMRNEYRVFDETGMQVGTIMQTKQSIFTFLARLGTDLDVALPVTLELTDASGALVLTMHKPWFRMALEVSRGDGALVGTVRKRVRLGKARFTIADATGHEVGEVRARNWRARDFAVVDTTERPVAEVNKKWRGLAREAFTDADTYGVRVDDGTTEPLRTLALGAAMAIDLIMKQKDVAGSAFDWT
ncbi:MAG TPA: LURP-one-related family protein [Actinomycetota bacterium]|nr:LURP-one-related family protein [Actinomycetota bacterium]